MQVVQLSRVRYEVIKLFRHRGPPSRGPLYVDMRWFVEGIPSYAGPGGRALEEQSPPPRSRSPGEKLRQGAPIASHITGNAGKVGQGRPDVHHRARALVVPSPTPGPLMRSGNSADAS